MPSLRTTRAAFSLIEILLVVMIIGIVSAVALPSFMRSMKGNRLRTAARTVVMSGRYARTMAVLEQRSMVLAFDLSSATVSIEPGRERPRAEDPFAPPPAAIESADAGGGAAVTASAGAGGADAGDGSVAGETAGGSAEGAAPRTASARARQLDGVTIKAVGLGEDSRITEGRCEVEYRPNGTCIPYSVDLGDADGRAVAIAVDRYAGATVETRP